VTSARRTAAHRRLPTPPYRAMYQVAGVWHKNCRLCDRPLLRPDGRPDLRRNWHAECAEAYLAATPNRIREIVFRRDRGLCAACGHDERLSGEWEADHRVPLIDGGGLELSNVQTLCVPCHRTKTAREAAARARARRIASAPTPGPLLGLMRWPA